MCCAQGVAVRTCLKTVSWDSEAMVNRSIKVGELTPNKNTVNFNYGGWTKSCTAVCNLRRVMLGNPPCPLINVESALPSGGAGFCPFHFFS